ncbi:hypothetical protein [Robiginitalea sp.]|uniref:hypothetical protein n=1 Tax=Robiginitalea sp. TaxID=1902411 RepID=UPI003C7897DD
MKIHYTKKRLRSNLFQGLLWLVFSITLMVSDAFWANGMVIGYLVIAALFMGSYFYERHYGYLTLKADTIQKNTLIGKPIGLSEVRRIKKFAGDYILETETAKMTINTQIIAPDCLKMLDEALSAIELPPQLTPFGHAA